MPVVLVLLMVGLASGKLICPDGTECEDKNTCCQTETGYACCHYPSAVCCPDKAHCCPPDYQCDVGTQLCKKKELQLYRLSHSPQIPAEEEEKSAPAPLVKSGSPSVSVVHCDNTYVCPDGTTCCRSPYGQWSCCIYSPGQCCPDGIHCCPFGYHCDSTSTRCLRGTLSLPASPQIAAVQINTIQAVCCPDKAHCCPPDYQCDVGTQLCKKKEIQLYRLSCSPQIPAEEEEKSAPAPLVKSGSPSVSVVHCDNTYVCPDGTTCCRSPYGQWSCCIYSPGQCCIDGIHCCPFGYHCDSTSTRCLRGTLSLPASPQIAAVQINTIQDE